MRTTVEIDDGLRAELHGLAAGRGEKGISGLVREALELYLAPHRARKAAVERALALQGSFDGAAARVLQASLRPLRGQWR